MLPRPLKLKFYQKNPEQMENGTEGNFGVKVYISKGPMMPRKFILCDLVLEPLKSILAFSSCVCMKGAPLVLVIFLPQTLLTGGRK